MAVVENIPVGIRRLRQLSRQLDARTAEFARARYNKLVRIEKKLDRLFLGLFTAAILFDGVSTAFFCVHPVEEANGLARFLMACYGIELGLYFAVLILSFFIISGCGLLSGFSDWFLKRASIDFPVARRCGGYMILLAWVVKSIGGGLSWLLLPTLPL